MASPVSHPIRIPGFFPEADDATLRISFDALIPAIRKGGRLTQSDVSTQLSIMKAIQAKPDTSEGVLWTNAYNK